MAKVKTPFAVLLLISVLGLAACGDDDGDKGGTTTATEGTGTSAKKGSEPILIKTHLDPPNARDETTGEVRPGSTIGDSPFCAGGKFLDGPVKPTDMSVVRIFRCPGGTLTVKFTSTPPDVKQRSGWTVVKGLGRFEGLSGGGRMEGTLESGDEARETFTGTVTQ
jgi:hypothetical protein